MAAQHEGPVFETRLGPFCSGSLNLPVGVNAPG